MYLIFGPIIGFIVGVMVGKMIDRKNSTESRKVDNKDRLRIKKEKLELLRIFVAGKKEITNKEVEDFLEMSDATTTRYLDELEKEGLVKQIGKVGANVKYEVK